MIQQFHFWVCTQRTESRVLKRYVYAMFIAALFTIAKRWKQPKCPLMDEWINKMWYIHTMDYCYTLKRKEIPTHAVSWVNVEDIILSDISSNKKTNSV